VKSPLDCSFFLTNEVPFQTEAVNTAYAARFGAAAFDHDTVTLTSGH
jgi:hypothetical protein